MLDKKLLCAVTKVLNALVKICACQDPAATILHCEFGQHQTAECLSAWSSIVVVVIIVVVAIIVR